MANQNVNIGFVGIGNMGTPMAGNLLKAGWKVTVYDVDAGKTRGFAGVHGAAAAFGLAELGRKSDVIITMLPDGAVVRRVVLGKESGDDCLVKGLAKGTTIIDMSSSAPVGTRRLGEDLRAYGISLIDAPVSGGVKGAVAATMSIMIGGDKTLAERLDPLLAAAEAVRIAEKFGIDPQVLVNVINASTGRNNSTENKFAQFILNRKFNSGFALSLMAKDLALAMEVAEACEVPAEFGHATLDLWKRAEKAVGAAADHTEIARYVKDQG